MGQNAVVEQAGARAGAGAAPSSRERVMRLAWVTLVVLVLALFAVRLVADGPYGKDFTSFLTGGRMLLAGQAGDLYDLAAQAKAQRPIAGPYVYEGGVLPFIYPPYVAALFVPFALIPPDVAYYLWTTLQGVLLLVFVAWAMRSFGEWRLDAPRALPFALLAFQPVVETLLQGQTSIISLLLRWWALVAWHNERWAMLGVAVGLSAFKPQLAVLLVVALLPERRWRALGYATLTQAVLWAGPLLLAGPGVATAYADLLRITATSVNTLGLFPHAMPNLRGLLTIAGLPTEAVTWLSTAAWLLSMAGAYWVWRGGGSLAVKFGLVTVLSVLFATHLNVHDATVLLAAAVCLLLAAPDSIAAAQRLDRLFVPFLLVFLAMYTLVLGPFRSFVPVILAVWLLGVVLLWMLWLSGRRVAADAALT